MLSEREVQKAYVDALCIAASRLGRLGESFDSFSPERIYLFHRAGALEWMAYGLALIVNYRKGIKKLSPYFGKGSELRDKRALLRMVRGFGEEVLDSLSKFMPKYQKYKSRKEFERGRAERLFMVHAGDLADFEKD